MVYLSYQQGTFKTRSPSKPRGRSVARREKSPETTHPRSKSRAKSEPGDTTVKRRGRPVGSKNKPK